MVWYESGGSGEDFPLGHRVMHVTQHLGGGIRSIPGSVWQLLSWFFYCVLMWIVSMGVWPWRGATSETKSLPTAEEQPRSTSGKRLTRGGTTMKDSWQWKERLSCQDVSAQVPSSVGVQQEPGRVGQLARAAPGDFLKPSTRTGCRRS